MNWKALGGSGRWLRRGSVFADGGMSGHEPTVLWNGGKQVASASVR
jgi:hypothetical protein